jgi:SCF-associated factor 1
MDNAYTEVAGIDSTTMTSSLTDLPLDLLVLIFPLLDAKDFLSLCRTCKGLYQPQIRLESSYWSHATRSKFRIRNRPAEHSDGLHWQRLYKRLLTQSRVYTWGQNTNECLGRGTIERVPRTMGRHRRLNPGRLDPSGSRTAWPEQMNTPQELGVVADLQCGGWSTSVLNDKGVLRTVGTLNGMSQYNSTGGHLNPMIYPPAFPRPEERYDPAVALREFSSGRTHILGLSDSGIIWAWHNAGEPSQQVQFNNIAALKASKVVAGWNKSSAYLRGTGIVVWDILDAPEEPDTDTREIETWAAVPKTDYQRPRGSARDPDESTRLLGEQVGEVTNYIALEHYIVFVTDIKKIFAAQIEWNDNTGIIHDTFELIELQSHSENDPTPSVTDVQGSFRSFAVFKRDGEVITTDQEYLDARSARARHESSDRLPTVTRIPALQNTGVTSIAFGDYHYHALHSDGSISSYGREPGACGALGLGGGMGVPIPVGTLRGIKYNPWNADGTLLPHAYFRGRKIWFHHEQEEWLRMLASGGKDHEEAAGRVRMCSSVPPVQGEVSEWIEQMGGDWDKRPEVLKLEEDGLGAYFALSVAAAGWHSGALVLVNEKLVKAVEESCMVTLPDDTGALQEEESQEEPEGGPSQLERTLTSLTQGFLSLLGIAEEPESPQKHQQRVSIDFPRLILDGDVEMEGTIPFSRWVKEKPNWKLQWRGDDFTGKVFGMEGWAIDE